MKYILLLIAGLLILSMAIPIANAGMDDATGNPTSDLYCKARWWHPFDWIECWWGGDFIIIGTEG